MTREDIQLKFRVPASLKARLERAAHTNKRSLNAEITARLEASFASDARSKSAAAKLSRVTMEGDSLETRVAEIEARLSKLERQK
jgi:hypothetical protein